MIRRAVPDVFLLAGVAIAVRGVWGINQDLALIVLGVCLVVTGLRFARLEAREKGGAK